MDTSQITTALRRLFDEEKERIVFWNDPEREFAGVLDSLDVPQVNVLRLDEVSEFEVKLRIEQDDPAGKYLLYAPSEEPDLEGDWLLDIRLYGKSFRADRASIILDQLGLTNQHLRQHLAKRRKFLDNKDRLRKLQSLVDPTDNEADLDRKMLAVVVRAEQPELFNIVRTLFHEFTVSEQDRDLFTQTESGEIDLDSPPQVWDQIEKYDLAEPFWQMIKAVFGYEEESSSLRNLLIRLLVTDFGQAVKGNVPGAFLNLLLPKVGWANAVVCLGQWRDSTSKGSSYDRLSGEVATLLKLPDQLDAQDLDGLVEVMTFLDVEKAVIRGLRDRVQNTFETIAADEIREIATRRQAGHWASPGVSGSPEIARKTLHAVYDALVAAADFFGLRNEHRHGFVFDDAVAMYRAYETELFRFDQLYRHFCESADYAESEGWGVLKPLRSDVEGCYSNWFITNLALGWGKFIEPISGGELLAKWRIEGIPNQQRFFERLVRQRLAEAENRRVYVIISDAFRFEAAEELTRDLNGKYRFEASLESQLGVLPSYTALGMAALLPHRKLAYKPNADVLADGKPTSSITQRNDILNACDGMAVKSDELLAMKKEEGRDYVSGCRVIYVYHNVVDSTGDSAASEDHTFEAVRKAITEVGDIVRYAINNLNANYVVVTADHGFIFRETPPGETDKSKLTDKPPETVKSKKRYLLGHNLPDHDAVWHGDTSATADAEGEMEFWIPKGANRFHFTGGAKFVHGGAMLQEIVVPVITVKHLKDKKIRGKTKTKPVTVHLLGTSHKITTARHRFELIQMEPVSDRVKAVTVKFAVYEGDDPVTNVETVMFDSTSGNIDERKKWVTLTLRDRQYDKKTTYRLILRDADTGVEQESADVIIDRAFTDDF